jgi:hypothetical protein
MQASRRLLLRPPRARPLQQQNSGDTVAMSASPASLERDPRTVDVPREFHRRMAAIIDAVQTGLWQAGVHDLLGYATDYAFGDKRGLQTLVLKTSRRSAYVRLQWEVIMGDSPADSQMVENAINNAIQELT